MLSSINPIWLLIYYKEKRNTKNIIYLSNFISYIQYPLNTSEICINLSYISILLKRVLYYNISLYYMQASFVVSIIICVCVNIGRIPN